MLAIGLLATTGMVAPWFLREAPGVLVLVFAAAYCVGTSLVLGRTLLNARLGQSLPLAPFVLLAFGVAHLKRKVPAAQSFLEHAWPTFWFRGLLLLAAALWVAGVWTLAVRLLRARDVDRLWE